MSGAAIRFTAPTIVYQNACAEQQIESQDIVNK